MNTISTERTLTIRETADATGLTIKAVRLRVERGGLPSVLRDGKRRIPVSELHRKGLLGGTSEAPSEAQNSYEVPTSTSAPQFDVGVLLDRLEAQAAKAAEYRVLTEQAESARATTEADLFEARARIGTLEQQLAERDGESDPLKPRRWFGLRSK